MEIPSVATRRLLLRPFTMQDSQAMFEILHQENVLRYFPGSEPPPFDRVEEMLRKTLSHWQERGYGLWAIESLSSGEFMGRCGLQYLAEFDKIEVDYILGTSFWGQGLATEAAQASLDWGISTLNLQRVVGIAHVDNQASQRVLEKVGMEQIERKELWGIDCFYYAWQMD
jgi:ribosomal-protein-alanine N-acetyltransferase